MMPIWYRSVQKRFKIFQVFLLSFCMLNFRIVCIVVIIFILITWWGTDYNIKDMMNCTSIPLSFENLLSDSVLKRCLSALLSILDGPVTLAVERFGIPGVTALGPRISLRTSRAFWSVSIADSDDFTRNLFSSNNDKTKYHDYIPNQSNIILYLSTYVSNVWYEMVIFLDLDIQQLIA